MGWLKIDDKIGSHPKVLRAGADAAWLWLCAIAYGQNHVTDGFLPTEALGTLGAFSSPPFDLAQRLVAVRLLEVVDGGYLVHDYHSHNPSREEVARRRDGAARRKAEQRQRVTPERVTQESQRDTVVTDTGPPRDSRAHVPTPTPTPTPKEPDQEHVSADADARVRFERFWEAYPRKTNKAGALTKWRQRRVSEALTDIVIEALERHKLSRQWREGVIPHAATWLHQERWNDEVEVEPLRPDEARVRRDFALSGQRRPSWRDECQRLKHQPPCGSEEFCLHWRRKTGVA